MIGAPPWAAHLAPGRRWEDVDLGAGGSIPAVTATLARAAPERPVLHAPGRGWVTRGELEDRSARLAGRLAGIGLRTGDRILCSAEASAALVELHLAALRLGAVVVPANTAYLREELAHLVRDARPVAAVVDRADAAAWVAEAAPEVVVLDPNVDVPDGPVPALDRAEAGDPGMICYTSGTTGRPKGAVLTHGNLLAGVHAVRLAWRWTEDDRLVLALPLFHVHGLAIGLHGTLVAGAAAVLVPRFTPEGVLDAVAGHGATLFFGVPTMYARLAADPRGAELSRLRLCVSGSAPLDPALHRRIRERTGQVVLERYGMTETLLLVSNPHDGERRPGTVGWPLPGVELRLGPGDEIVVRGPSVFPGYWERPDGDAFSDGWFRTGDVGRFDEGYLRIVGRTKDLIITGGLNVYPREVEDALLDHPAVAEVAVVGVPSGEWGETVVAFVVASPAREPVEAELIDHCRARLASFKCPREVRVVRSLPRNALGKVLRDQVGLS
ncbi:MAG TPA: AMP-binding protein [Acidimicrobiales bacterium]